ncbi:MAG TPA: hypothetical protein VGB14_13680 [Acidimicrobiales bacterium]|jgi:hypothetical protein
MRLARVLCVVLVAVTGACGADGRVIGTAAEPTGGGPPPGEDPGGPIPAPPPVTVRAGTTELELRPWTYCYGNGCADGIPPSDPPDVGATDRVEVAYPLPGWRFGATFRAVGSECPRQQEVALEHEADGTWSLGPAGPAGTYDVTLFGQGDGDLFVTFRWTTPRDGPMPTPAARLAVVADHDGRPDSYGVELELSSLAATPDEAVATVTVRAANGRSTTFTATRAPGCIAEGTVYWDGPDADGLAAAALGDPPFTYEVEVVLDGTRHRATAVWPDDQIEGNEPSVALAFDPALPALR